MERSGTAGLRVGGPAGRATVLRSRNVDTASRASWIRSLLVVAVSSRALAGAGRATRDQAATYPAGRRGFFPSRVTGAAEQSVPGWTPVVVS